MHILALERKRKREKEEGKKCRAQDLVSSHMDHLANTVINTHGHAHTCIHTHGYTHAYITTHTHTHADALSQFSAHSLNLNNFFSICFIIKCALTSSLSYLFSVRHTTISLICERVYSVFSPPPLHGPPLSAFQRDIERPRQRANPTACLMHF